MAYHFVANQVFSRLVFAAILAISIFDVASIRDLKIFIVYDGDAELGLCVDGPGVETSFKVSSRALLERLLIFKRISLSTIRIYEKRLDSQLLFILHI